MTKYSGLVVGGPMDGESLAHHMPYYQVCIKPELSEEWGWETSPIPVETLSYTIYGIYGQFFWIPTGKDYGWLMERLAVAYWRLAGLSK